MASKLTFFQAVDDAITCDRAGITFEAWLDRAKRRFKVHLGVVGLEEYTYEVLHAFYPPEGIDAIVPAWEAGSSPEEYALRQYRAARPQRDLP